jgi:hypothetical protein
LPAAQLMTDLVKAEVLPTSKLLKLREDAYKLDN